MTPEQRNQVGDAVAVRMKELEARIEEYRELTKPTGPDDAIGRVSRMDAINNRSVNEAALRQAEKQHAGLKRALNRIDDEDFGRCVSCRAEIPLGRIMLMPGATTCVRCGA